VFGQELRRAVEEGLRRCAEIVAAPNVSRKALLEAIVAAETSEINDAFLYVLRVCRPQSKAFQYVASSVQEHEDRITAFIRSVPPRDRPERGVCEMPRIWEGQILLVDDDPTVLDVLRHALGKFGRVETARNGREGLQRAKTEYYDAVISDVDMPEMDGPAFLQAAIEEDASIAERFLLMSGRPTPELRKVCEERHVPFIQKPFSLGEMRAAVAGLVKKIA
jgi:CheY-like chemotaxis protein